MYEHEYVQPETANEMLIPGRFQAPPTSVAHLADRVEASGAKIEETLNKLNFSVSQMFFLTGWVIIIGGVLSFLGSLLSLQLVGMLRASFLTVFGLIQMVLDIPGAPRWASRYRLVAFKQVKFLTRLTGKGLWNLFISSLMLVCLWPNTMTKTAPFSILFTLLLSALVFATGLVAIFIGFRKTLRLEKVRKEILSRYRGNTAEVYRKYAITDPTHGMQCDEFNRICSDFSQGRLNWSITDLAVIFNALDEHQKGAVSEREFCEWCAGAMTYL